jgi:CYTH domain-containing protein
MHSRVISEVQVAELKDQRESASMGWLKWSGKERTEDRKRERI